MAFMLRHKDTAAGVCLIYPSSLCTQTGGEIPPQGRQLTPLPTLTSHYSLSLYDLQHPRDIYKYNFIQTPSTKHKLMITKDATSRTHCPHPGVRTSTRTNTRTSTRMHTRDRHHGETRKYRNEKVLSQVLVEVQTSKVLVDDVFVASSIEAGANVLPLCHSLQRSSKEEKKK